MEQIDWCALLPAPMLPRLLSLFFVVNHRLTKKQGCRVREFDWAGKSQPSPSFFVFHFSNRSAIWLAWSGCLTPSSGIPRTPTPTGSRRPTSCCASGTTGRYSTRWGRSDVDFLSESSLTNVRKRTLNQIQRKINFYDKCTAAVQEVPQYNCVVLEISIPIRYQYFIILLK